MLPGTLGFRATGRIERDDYDRVLGPALHRALEAGTGLRTLYLVEALESVEPAALWEDSKLGYDLGVRHHDAWVRSAIVTDIAWMAHAARLFAWMIPGWAIRWRRSSARSGVISASSAIGLRRRRGPVDGSVRFKSRPSPVSAFGRPRPAGGLLKACETEKLHCAMPPQRRAGHEPRHARPAARRKMGSRSHAAITRAIRSMGQNDVGGCFGDGEVDVAEQGGARAVGLGERGERGLHARSGLGCGGDLTGQRGGRGRCDGQHR